MPLAALLSALSLGEPSITVVTSACYAHFATPCAIQTVPAVVDEVVEALELHPGQEAGVLANVSYALFNRDYGFWPSVFNETGAYVASGRPASGDVPSGRSLQGQLLETVAAAEAGIDQVGLWDRVKQAAAAGDGYFIHAALDLYADHEMENVSNAVTRVGHVRSVDTNTHGRLYVVSSFSSKPLAELAATQPCDVQYDAPCSIAYARKVLGLVATDMLRAATEGQLQQVFLAATAREYNEHGFYPFIFMTNGTNVAHGANSANLGRTLQDIVDNAASLQGLSIDDELADGVKDGIGDTYYLLVAVSGAAPMMTAAPKSLTGGAYECLQRPSVSLAPDASAMVSERIKCVTSLDEIGSDPAHCSNPDKDDVCPDSQNEWSDDAYSLDGGCHHLVQDGSWENSTVCDCEDGYARRFAARRVLGQADLPDDARCSAPAYECAPSDLNCVNRSGSPYRTSMSSIARWMAHHRDPFGKFLALSLPLLFLSLLSCCFCYHGF